MNQIHGNSIALDLIGISSEYKGGASIFAKTLLSEFIKMSDQELIVIYPRAREQTTLTINLAQRKISPFTFSAPEGAWSQKSCLEWQREWLRMHLY